MCRTTRLLVRSLFLCGISLPGVGDAVGQPPIAPVAAQAQQPAGQLLRVRVEEDLVSAEMREMPLQRVLEELAARTGLVFEIAVLENEPITLRLQKVPLPDAIQRLVHPNNAIFHYGTGDGGQARITLVRIFSRNPRSPQPSLRYIGTGAITRTGDDVIESPEEAMRVLAESPDVDARQRAIEMLVAGKGEGVPQALLKALADTAPEVRAAAIEGLAGMGTRSAMPAILAALKDKHPGVRQSAISAVALLGDYENIQDLKPLTRDADRSVAAAADIVIRKLSVRRP